MNQDIQKQILIEQRISNEGKSIAVAYILWFIFGSIGGHRFYLNKTFSAVIMLILMVGGWITSFVLIGFIPLFIVAVWVLVDAFLIPGMVRKSKETLRRRLTTEMTFFSNSSIPASGL